ncbi:MAG TPA: hypothetical protein PLO29_02445 [Paludibacter sp.]|nr:MAG: hypothetical protein BWY08_00504 [Bacteroidetes bacterium ADurb.Bin174]HQB27786.1 hypothetical protein [Paludibacter sp.]
MKKLFLLFAVASFFVACAPKAAETTEEEAVVTEEVVTEEAPAQDTTVTEEAPVVQ